MDDQGGKHSSDEGEAAALLCAEDRSGSGRPSLDALQAFDLIGDGVVVVDDERRILTANQAAARLVGAVEPEELFGLRVEEVGALSNALDLEATWQGFLRTGKQDKWVPLVRPDGSRGFIEYRARSNLRDHEHLLVLRDVTERIEAQTVSEGVAGDHASQLGQRTATGRVSELALTKEALAAKTELLEAVLRHAPIGILIAEAPTGRLASMNEAFEALWRGTGPDTPNVDAYASWQLRNDDGTHRAPEHTQLARALRGETCLPEVLRFRRWDGAEGVMRTTAAPVRDQTGRVVAAVAACQDITGEVELMEARNRLHEELAGKTALLGAVVSHAPTGIVVTDALGRFVSVNERFKTIFGPDVPATVQEYSRWSVRHEDGRERDAASESALVHALRGETVTHRFQFTRSDGMERWICITAAPVHDESHRLVAAVALCEDISQDVELLQSRDRLVQQIEQERAKLKSLLTDLPIAAIVFEAPSFRIEMANDAYLAIIGKRDVVGKTVAEIHPGVATDSIHSHLLKVCQERTPRERREHPILLPGSDGGVTLRHFTNTFQPQFDEAGDVSRIVVTVMEVTQEVHARTLMAESAERLRTVLDEMPVGVNVRDAKTGDVLLSNKASTEILGVDVRDQTNPASWRVWKARYPDGRPLEADDHAFRRVMLTREPVRNQVVLLKPAGSHEDDPEIVVRSSATLIKGDGNRELVISVSEDITDEHWLLEQREQTARFAEMFIGILAHDLRGPLNAISMAASLLGAQASLGAGNLKRVQMITSSADRMANMVTQLLDLTRGRLAGGIPIERKPTDLVKVVSGVLDEISTSHGSIALGRHLPSEALGNWDGDRLAQVVSNVVGNAVQHGDRALPIEVRLRERDHTFELEVQSYGTPIPSDLLPVLFDPFRHGARSPNVKPGGLGLGLYITREIITAHGGEVRVSSTSADGTTFIVTLPKFARERGSQANVALRVQAEVNDSTVG